MCGEVVIEFYPNFKQKVPVGTKFTFDIKNIIPGSNLPVMVDGQAMLFPKDKVVATSPETPEEILYLSSLEGRISKYSNIVILEQKPKPHDSLYANRVINLLKTVIFPGEQIMGLYEFSFLENAKALSISQHEYRNDLETRYIYRDWLQNIALEAGIKVCRVKLYLSQNYNLMAEITYPGTDKKSRRMFADNEMRVEKLVDFINEFLSGEDV